MSVTIHCHISQCSKATNKKSIQQIYNEVSWTQSLKNEVSLKTNTNEVSNNKWWRSLEIDTEYLKTIKYPQNKQWRILTQIRYTKNKNEVTQTK